MDRATRSARILSDSLTFDFTLTAYEPETYEPSDVVTLLHGFYHYGSDEFDASDQSYLLAVAAPAAIAVFLGIILTLLAYFISVCSYLRCFRTGCCRRCFNPQRPWATRRTVRLLFLASGICMTLCYLIAFEQLNGALSSLANSVKSLGDVFQTMEDAAVRLYEQKGDDTLPLATMQAANRVHDGYSPSITLSNCALISGVNFNGFYTGTKTLRSALDGIAALLTDFSTDLEDTYSNYLELGLQGLTGLFWTIVLLGVCATSKGGRARCCAGWVLSLLSLVTLLALIVFIGIFMLLSVLFADFCMGPNASGPSTSMSNAAEENLDGPAIPLVNYYLTCRGKNTIIENLRNVSIALVDLNDVTTDPLVATLCDANGVDGISEETTESVGHFTTIMGQLQCSTISPLITDTVHGSLCDEAVTGMFYFWAFLCVATLFLLLAVICFPCVVQSNRDAKIATEDDAPVDSPRAKSATVAPTEEKKDADADDLEAQDDAAAKVAATVDSPRDGGKEEEEDEEKKDEVIVDAAAAAYQKLMDDEKAAEEAVVEAERLKAEQEAAAAAAAAEAERRKAEEEEARIKAARSAGEQAQHEAAEKLQSQMRAKASRQRVGKIREKKQQNRAAARLQARARGRSGRQQVGQMKEKKAQNSAAGKLQARARARAGRQRVDNIRNARLQFLRFAEDFFDATTIEAEKRVYDSAQKLQAIHRSKSSRQRVQVIREEKEAKNKVDRQREELLRLKKMEEQLKAEEEAIAAARIIRLRAEEKEAVAAARLKAEREAIEAARLRAAAKEAAAHAAADAAGVPFEEYKSLYRLFAETGGETWKAKTKWFDGDSRVEDWDRVEVEDGHVTKLMLSGNNMAGSIPWKYVSQFTELRVLNLNGNQLEGGISASELTKLKKLETLLLQNNQLGGRIPVDALRSLERLERMSLYNPPGPANMHIDKNSFELPPRGVVKRDLDCFSHESIIRLFSRGHWPVPEEPQGPS